MEQIVRIIATLLLALGLVLAYANRVLFDADAFADRAAASLGDPRVASFARRSSARRVSSSGPSPSGPSSARLLGAHTPSRSPRAPSE